MKDHDQDELFGIESIARARNTDPETSKAAARQLSTARSHCRLILEQHLEAPNGLTDEQAVERAGIEEGGWKRCSDLRRMGLIEWMRHDNGKIVKRVGSNNRDVGVSVITGEGRRELGSS